MQYDSAKNAYRRVLDRDPNHAKVLQQLGWLHHQQGPAFSIQEQAIEYLEKSVSSGRSCSKSQMSTRWLICIQTTPMRRAGISWVDVTCRSKSIPRPTRPISKQSTGMDAILRSGARLACFIIRSINTVMRLMHTPERSV